MSALVTAGRTGKMPIESAFARRNIVQPSKKGDPMGKHDPTPSQAICVSPVCDRPAHCRGMCDSHYDRSLRGGDPRLETPIRSNLPRACDVAQCDHKHSAHGYCKMHYRRWRRWGDPLGTRDCPVGTRRLDALGRIRVRIDPTDPFLSSMAIDKGNWCMEHRIIMARSIGRPLLRTETVHHRNGHRDDNNIANLELWVGNHGHGKRASDPHCPTCTCVQHA